MDTNQNTTFINTFTEGMNTDTAASMLKPTQYRGAKNVRFVTDSNNNTGELHTIDGTVLAGEFGDKIVDTAYIRDYGIVIYTKKYTSKQKDHIGHDVEPNINYIYIDRFQNPYSNSSPSKNNIQQIRNKETIFGPCSDYQITNKLSMVTRWEDINNAKLYIADGKDSICILNMFKHNGYSFEELRTFPTIKLNKFRFCGLTEGSLKSGQVQYSYQLYQKGGKVGQMSPPTNQIQISNKNNSTIDAKVLIGLEKQKASNSGVVLEVDIDADIINKQGLNSIKIYRIYYLEPGQIPEVGLVYDGQINAGLFRFTDYGRKSLQNLTLEEYNNYSGIYVIPRVIESKDNILFAANIKEKISTIDNFESYDARAFQFDPVTNKTHIRRFADKTSKNKSDVETYNIDEIKQKWADNSVSFITHDCYNIFNDVNEQQDDASKKTALTTNDVEYGWYDRFTSKDANGKQYYGGTGANISWRFVVSKLVGDGSRETIDPTNDAFGNATNTTNTLPNERVSSDDILLSWYVTSQGHLERTPLYLGDKIDYVGGMSYTNPKIAYSMKSLRRDELYRYGIVLYDKYGNASEVKWIADIRTPSIYTQGFEHFMINDYVQTLDGDEDDILGLSVRPLGIEFEIHSLPDGCVSYEIVRCNRSAEDVATITQGVVSRPIKRIFHRNYTGAQKNNQPYTPSGFLTTARYWSGYDAVARVQNKNFDKDQYNDRAITEADNYENINTFQFVSPEISYHRDSTFQLLGNNHLDVCPQLYLFGSAGGEKHNHVDSRVQYIGGSDGSGGLDPDQMYLDSVRNSDRYQEFFMAGANNTNIMLNQFKFYSWDTSNGQTYEFRNIEYQPDLSKDAMNQQIAISQRAHYIDHSYRMHKVGAILHDINKYDSYYTNHSTRISRTVVPPLKHSIKLDNINQSDIITYGSDGSKACENAFSYIKLYNQSRDVFLRGHVPGRPDQDMWLKSDNTFCGFPATRHRAQNKCEVTAFSLPVEMGWNDMLTGDNLKYADQITTIGSETYCNWVCGGLYRHKDGPFRDYHTFPEEKNRFAFETFGPAGRCLLFTINNEWKTNTSEKDGTYNRESFLFSDTLGADSTIQPGYLISNGSITDYVYDSQEVSVGQITYSEIRDGIQYHGLQFVTFKDSDYKIDRSKWDNVIIGDVNTNTYNTHQIYRESIFGTYLCNMRQRIMPYCGGDFQSRTLSQYYSFGDIYKSNDRKASIFNGDCYIQPFEYVSLHKYYTSKFGGGNPHMVVYSIPVETNINLSLTYGEEFSMNSSKGTQISNIQIEPSNVNGLYLQTKPLYSNNGAYNDLNKSKSHQAYDYYSHKQQSNNLDYRCRYSEQKSNNEYEDKWLVFKAGNYLDVDTRNGEITQLRTFKNSLMFFQENAFGQFSVNERTQISDNSNRPLILGTGGVLSRYDYITTTNGMKKNQFADTQSESTLYWFDYDRRELMAYSGGQSVLNLSKVKNIQNALNYDQGNGALNIQPTLFFDKLYNEAVFNVKDGDSLTYNEHTQSFISEYEIRPTSHIQFKNSQYLTVQNQIYQWNIKAPNAASSLFDKNSIAVMVDYVVNPNSQIVKTFDNQYFGATNINKDATLAHYDTPLNQSSDILSGDQITDREGDYRLAIPRNKNSVYGDRMKGKYMQCKLVHTDATKDMSLQYIMTKYRISCS